MGGIGALTREAQQGVDRGDGHRLSIGVARDRPRSSLGDRTTPNRTKRRGGSACGNGGTAPRTGSRGIGRVGPSGSKITRARNENRPGTSGGGRNQEGEALDRTPSAEVRLWAVFQRGSVHEPPPENVGRGRDVARSAAARRGWDAGPAAGACVASTPLNRPCAPVCGCGVEV